MTDPREKQHPRDRFHSLLSQRQCVHEFQAAIKDLSDDDKERLGEILAKRGSRIFRQMLATDSHNQLARQRS